jgi:hypothetical protein
MNQKDTKTLWCGAGAEDWLNSLCWHDSILYEIRLIRCGSADQVVLCMCLIQNWDKNISCEAEITFNDCLLVNTEMKWGVTCMSDGEMIYDGMTSRDGELVRKVLDEWKGLIDQKPLAQFTLDLASTGSSLAIVFKSLTYFLNQKASPHPAPKGLPLNE